MDTLEEIAAAMSREAIRSGVQIVTGDTKVVKRGQCDKLFINTAGIGLLEKKLADISGGVLINPGDQLLVNGYLGDHEMAILSARENITFEEPVVSDVVPLNHMIRAMLDAGVEIHFMRDITRGGLATILAELVSSHAFGVIVEELNLPIREQVTGLCELYGFNPLYLANEGKILAVVSAGTSTLALEVMQSFPEGEQARIIGNITASNSGKALIKSTIGGIRVLEKLAGEQLPRIC
jgi:hydrogenase expression/formation protein HypE